MKGKTVPPSSNTGKIGSMSKNTLGSHGNNGKQKDLNEKENQDTMFSTLLEINLANFDNLVGHLIATFSFNSSEALGKIIEIANKVISIRSNSFISIAQFLACVYNLLSSENAQNFVEKTKDLNPLLTGFIAREGVLTCEQVISIFKTKNDIALLLPILDLVKITNRTFYQELSASHKIETYNWFTLYSLIISDDLTLTIKCKELEMLYPYRGELCMLPIVVCSALAGSKRLFMSYINSGVSPLTFDIRNSRITNLAAAVIEGGNPDIVKELVKANVDIRPFKNQAAHGHHIQIFSFIMSKIDKNFKSNKELQNDIRKIADQEDCPELESLLKK